MSENIEIGIYEICLINDYDKNMRQTDRSNFIDIFQFKVVQ